MRFSLILTVLAFAACIFTPAERFEDIKIDWNNLLGQGNFGKVYKARSSRTRSEYAVKILTPTDHHAIQQTKSEVQVLKELTQKRVTDITELKFYKTIGQKFYLGFDLFSGDLSKFIYYSSQAKKQRYSEFIAFRLIRTLKNLHEAGYGNFDIKPANTLLDNDVNPHMADFGLAMKVRSYDRFPGGRGDMAYISPEMLNGRGYTRQSDVWSLGVTLIELFTGRNPFHYVKGKLDLERMIRTYSFPNNTPLPNLGRHHRINWAHVISKYMIQPDTSRITAKALYEKVASHLGHDPRPEFSMFLEEDNEPIGFSNKSDAHPLSERFCITKKNGIFVEC